MWIFGGFGPQTAGFLNDHGSFVQTDIWGLGCNNQVFCYNPSSQIWENVAYTRNVPSPRAYASATISNKVWLCSKPTDHLSSTEDFYALNMNTLTWTQIATTMPSPVTLNSLFTPITDSQLLFHTPNAESNDNFP